ncbi:AAA family ATPase [Rubneribacter sp.]
MQAAKRYPVGRQVFSEVREGGFFYADKTRYVYDLAHLGGKYVFLSRPRRFGKTLLVSTMEAYFQGRRELFEGLAAAELEGEWREHPVLRFDLSTVKASDLETLRQDLDRVLRRLEEVWGRDEADAGVSPRVEGLIVRAHERTGEQAVVLVDEYDAPLLNVVHDPERLLAFREVMREFYSPMKAMEPHLRFVFLTGITKFSQLSVFSELNNIKNVSMLPAFAGVCGITSEELEGPLAPDVVLLAERMGVSEEECRAALKAKYDGYRFCAGSPHVYNPYSLVNAFEDGRMDSYWFGSGTPSSLVRMLKSSDFDIPELEGVEAFAYDFDAPTEGMATLVPFMYQAGYLTIKGYDPLADVYTLGIPNEEVREGLYGALLPAYAPTGSVERTGFLAGFVRAVYRDDDMDAALRCLRSFLAAIPYDMAPKCEKDFQTVLFLAFSLVGARIRSEVRTSAGRVDLVVESASAVYVMELKYGGTAEEALAQIDSKGYCVPWESNGKRVVKVGVSFDPERRTIDENWIIQGA